MVSRSHSVTWQPIHTEIKQKFSTLMKINGKSYPNTRGNHGSSQFVCFKVVPRNSSKFEFWKSDIIFQFNIKIRIIQFIIIDRAFAHALKFLALIFFFKIPFFFNFSWKYFETNYFCIQPLLYIKIFQYLLLCHSKSARQCGSIWRLEWTKRPVNRSRTQCGRCQLVQAWWLATTETWSLCNNKWKNCSCDWRVGKIVSYRMFVSKFCRLFFKNVMLRGNFLYPLDIFRLLESKYWYFSDTERYILGEIEDSEDFEWSSSIEAPFLDTYSGSFSYKCVLPWIIKV